MQPLYRLAEAIGITPDALPARELPITSIAYNSRNATEGSLFVCLVGAVTDGHRYAGDAYLRGCRVFVAQRKLDLPEDALVLYTENSRTALAELSAAFFDHPERELTIVGVTGTKGKSTVCEMLRHILCAEGIAAASIGTVGVRIGDELLPTVNTTPESYELFRIFADMRERGVTHVAMEVSSQGVKLDRIHGIRFHTAIMTNLSPDHIGEAEHPTFEDYKACKEELFRRTELAILNADDPYADEFRAVTPVPTVLYGLGSDADLSAHALTQMETEHGFGIRFSIRGSETQVTLPFPGEFSVKNALAAIAAAGLLGICERDAARALSSCAVKGRLELVPTPIPNVTFVIDYAHNGESLTAALKALRAYEPTRLICLFGSVGGRTEIRRRELGMAAAEYADLSILTSDNPDREDPAQILSDIERYMGDAPRVVIPDRKEAIEYAVSIAEPHDIVLFAGKGHENYQLVSGKKLPFCEREIILAAAEALRIRP
ncbi:MAG: UDP-N-acetylmuramoyl-L-alanyl-D-glutamate--2,6-diaminopimelate ligase [Clostridia bacterium]|nr:UDP-N-acetylmuramoyl-L-alanyl-D-glutamate--2,6-diaminopimelate ligase [Clostridia bacterium]